MNYIEVKFICSPNDEITTSVLSSVIGDIGFESFVESEEGLIAYVLEDSFDEGELNSVIANFPLEGADITYNFEVIEGRDWNEEWEKNYFKPLIIDERCIIQSTFHNEPAVYEYNILIDPKMAFGTGHHQTTKLMIRQILNMDVQGKSVLDMGAGTAVLAILASMRGANPVTAIDIDKWAYDNAIENLHLNNINNIDVLIGGAELLGNQKFDVILANINRNILLNDIHKYASVLNPQGELYMSGFYVEDIPAIQDECEKYGLSLKDYAEDTNWAVVKFIKG
ncbi:50S ribosomal protein L11 methyltransferase [Dysgonomonas sp. 216]|uniref:50S ribosomal protein L11 methyltransferase n=1 Tax=Dysgonomonas sp. 216 TaxID=2302934 RepID=UPI0013D7825C|nr:50S ribosomal protein L11 methyltransferase [Dysgonomonas sp. 216]NDW19793.1 50S ribosomal protein L11 methyltransferase [Dysgonomonas sp. 216]